MKPGAPRLQSALLLDQVRERVRYMHYSLKTEKADLYWVRFFVRWSATRPGGMRHLADGAADGMVVGLIGLGVHTTILILMGGVKQGAASHR